MKTERAEGHVLVTGGTGFVGRHLVQQLHRQGWRVRVALRSDSVLPTGIEGVVVGDLGREIDWTPALKGISAIVHAAGIAHTGPGLPDELYMRVNAQATQRLAQAAMGTGAVTRFVFLSSIRAMTGPVAGKILTDDDEPAPTDAYGRSKLAAEEALQELEAPYVALRPVLVHGPGVAGNLGQLARLAKLPVPLPLASLKGRRSIVGIDNLADAVLLALKEPRTLGRSLIVADLESLTVGEIVAAIRAGLGRRPGLFGCPENLLRGLARLVGKNESLDRLSGDLVVRPDALLSLGWRPRLGAQEGLGRLLAATSPPVSGP